MTLDTLHLVFSAFGTVQKIATFEKQSGFQALVQYPDAATAEQVWALRAQSYVRASIKGVHQGLENPGPVSFASVYSCSSW